MMLRFLKSAVEYVGIFLVAAGLLFCVLLLAEQRQAGLRAEPQPAPIEVPAKKRPCCLQYVDSGGPLAGKMRVLGDTCGEWHLYFPACDNKTNETNDELNQTEEQDHGE